MKKKMNIFAWMGIFLFIIQSDGCDSTFRERSIIDTSRRFLKCDSSNRIDRYRILDKNEPLKRNSLKFELDDATSTSDSETGTIISLELTRETFQAPRFSAKKGSRISMKESSASKSVIEFFPHANDGIRISKGLALKEDISLKTAKPIRISRGFSNERKNRFSDDRRMDRQVENMRSRRLNIRRENINEKRMLNMRFQDTGSRKAFRMVKWETSDFRTPSQLNELFRKQTQLAIPKQFSFKGRVRNAARQEANGIERFVRKDRYNTRDLPNLKRREMSMERNTDSKLQQPRYERHLLVSKRELKIPSGEVTVRTDNSRRSRKSIWINDFNLGNVEETMKCRINGRGLQRTLGKRLDHNRRQSIEAVGRYRQNRIALLESGRIKDLMGTRKSAYSSGMESYERIQHRRRTDVLDSNRRDREVSTRTITTVFQDLKNDNSNRKLRTNELHSNRQKDKLFVRRPADAYLEERVRFNRERKLSSENRQLMMRANSKENIPDDLQIRSRSIRNRDRATDTLKNRMRRAVENEPERKQLNVRSDERFSTQFRFQSNNERSVSTIHNKLREPRSKNKVLRIRNRRNDRVMKMETRQSIMRLKQQLNERFVKYSDEFRNSANKEIAKIRSIINSSSQFKGDMRMTRSEGKEITSLDLKTSNANRRSAINQCSERRAEKLCLNTENDRSIRKVIVKHRMEDSRNRRFEPRINAGRSARTHRIRDESKQSKLGVSSDLTKESSVRTATKTGKEINGGESKTHQRRISVPENLISTPKFHCTVTNSTFKDNVPSSVSKFREIASLKKLIVSSDRTTKFHRSITAPKSSSSNNSFMDYYEYLYEKRSSFISLILNVMLGLAVIVASSDDKNKGFIPRRLTPFVDGFLKYTTVI